MPYGVRAYQLCSRASRTSSERIENAGSATSRNGISVDAAVILGDEL